MRIKLPIAEMAVFEMALRTAFGDIGKNYTPAEAARLRARFARQCLRAASEAVLREGQATFPLCVKQQQFSRNEPILKMPHSRN